ncbi:MAG: YkoF family thiamine/hydroxymethylpyrimidine-binding protein [Flavobacteriales bacterium]
MKLSVEVSMYPLEKEYIPLIDTFISGLNKHPEITVETNFMSTHIRGDFDAVMEVFTREIKAAYQSFNGKIIFSTKFLNS